MAFTIGPLQTPMNNFRPQIGPQVDAGQLGQLLQSSNAYAQFFSQQSGQTLNGQPDSLMSGQDQHPLLGGMSQAYGLPSAPDDNVFKTSMPNHPRLAGMLGGLVTGMASVPGIPGTTGDSLNKVATAARDLPYNRLMQAYRMVQPGLETEQLQSKLGLEQAQTDEARSHAFYYGERNQANVSAAEARAQATQQSAYLRAMLGNMQEGVQEAPDDDPQGRWSKGEPLHGYWQRNVANDGNVADPTFHPSGLTYKEYISGGGISSTGAVSNPGGTSGNSVTGKTIQSLMARYPDLTYDEARNLAVKQAAQATAQGGLGPRGAAPVTTQQDEEGRRASLRDADQKAFANLVRPQSEIDKLSYKDVPNLAASVDIDAALASHKQSMQDSNKQVRDAYGRYQNLPWNSKYKQPGGGGFSEYMQDLGSITSSGSGGPTSRTAPLRVRLSDGTTGTLHDVSEFDPKTMTRIEEK